MQSVVTPGGGQRVGRDPEQRDQYKILIVGDSQTREFPALETERVVCWPGATFEDVPRRLGGIEGGFHIIVLFLGIQRRRPQTMTLSKAIAQIREVIFTKWPGARILVTNAPPRGAQNLRAQVQTTNIQIAKCAKKFDLLILNIHKALCRQQKHCETLKRDGVHLTPAAPQGPANKYISLRDRRSRRGDTIFGAKFSIRLFRYYIKFLNKENMHTYTPTVFCCIPMAVCHRWSRYLPIYISFARGMLKVTTTYARRMC